MSETRFARHKRLQQSRRTRQTRCDRAFGQEISAFHAPSIPLLCRTGFKPLSYGVPLGGIQGEHLDRDGSDLISVQAGSSTVIHSQRQEMPIRGNAVVARTKIEQISLTSTMPLDIRPEVYHRTQAADSAWRVPVISRSALQIGLCQWIGANWTRKRVGSRRKKSTPAKANPARAITDRAARAHFKTSRVTPPRDLLRQSLRSCYLKCGSHHRRTGIRLAAAHRQGILALRDRRDAVRAHHAEVPILQFEAHPL